MKTASPLRSSKRTGFTLLEMTVVIAAILSLTTVLFVGARAWKNGSDRTACILNIRNVQVAVRSYQNMYGYAAGGTPYAEGGTQDIALHLFNKGYITDQQSSAIQGDETCPGGGNYARDYPDIFPEIGELYLNCSLSEIEGHAPSENSEW